MHKDLRAVSVIGLALQMVVDHTERVAVAVVAASLHVKVERVRLAAVAVLAFHVLRTDAPACIEKSIFFLKICSKSMFMWRGFQ